MTHCLLGCRRRSLCRHKRLQSQSQHASLSCIWTLSIIHVSLGTLTHLRKVIRGEIGKHLRLNSKEVTKCVKHVALHNTQEPHRDLLHYVLVLIDKTSLPVVMGVLMGSSMAHLGSVMGGHLYIKRHNPWGVAVVRNEGCEFFAIGHYKDEGVHTKLECPCII